MGRGNTSLLATIAVAAFAVSVPLAVPVTAASAQRAARAPLAIGVRVPRVFLTPDYVVADPSEWALPPAGPDLRWVRHYDDAALVDDDGVVRGVVPVDWSVTADGAAAPVVITGTPIAQPAFPPAPIPPPVLRVEPLLTAPRGVDPRCYDVAAPAPGRNPMIIGPCPFDPPGVVGYSVPRPSVTTVTIDAAPVVTTTTTTYYDPVMVDEDGYEVPPRTRRARPRRR